MNWNPLRKLTITHRPDFDRPIQYANETLEKLIVDFETAENVTKSLHLAAKKLPDHILCTGKFETKLVDDVSRSSLFADDEFMRNIVEEWHSFAFLTNTIGDEYVISVQKSLLEPLKQLRKAFSDLRAAIRLHETVQFDVIKYQRKVASYNEKEKTGTNVVKLSEAKQSLTASQREYSMRTHTLINDLSKFLTGSADMLKPLLEGFIAAEIAWIRACEKALESKPHISSSTIMPDNQSDRMKNIENTFKSMGSLKICSDPK